MHMRFNKQNKIIIGAKSISLLFLLTLSAVFVNPIYSKAQEVTESEFDLRIEGLPEDNPVSSTEYLNAVSTGFRVYARPRSGSIFREMAIFVDNQTMPLDSREYDNSSSEYYLSSNTSSHSELSEILPEGSHQIHFRYKAVIVEGQASPFIDYQSFNINSDFIAPSGDLTYENSALNTDEKLSLGEKVVFRFAPTIKTTDVATVSFVFDDKTYSGVYQDNGDYVYTYTVVEGDTSPATELLELSCKITDIAGNILTKTIQTNLSVDGQPIKIRVLNPKNGERYPFKNIDFSYEVSEECREDVLTIYLDGVLLEGSRLTNLAQGDHILRFFCTDQAGNTTQEVVVFGVDTIAPLVEADQKPNSSYILGESISVTGSSEAGTEIFLKVMGDDSEMIQSKRVGQNGRFDFSLSADKIGLGIFELSLVARDSLGNLTEIFLGSIEIKQSEAKAETLPVVVAQAPSAPQKNDMTPAIIRSSTNDISRSKEPVDLTKNDGQIITANDVKVPSVAYSSFILTAGLIIIAIALFASGYYGYEMVLAGYVAREEAQVRSKEAKKENELSSPISQKDQTIKKDSKSIQGKSDKEGDEQTHVRW